MGALGSLTVKWLSFSARSLSWLIGRSGRFSKDRKDMLKHSNLSVISCIKSDISMSEDSEELNRKTLNSTQIVNNVLHAGAVLDGRLLNNITSESIRQTFSAKVFGGRRMLQLAAPLPVHSNHLFSSVASFSGVPGQAIYAAANGVLDAWAELGQSAGLPIMSGQWGNWSGSGMAADDDAFVNLMAKMGLGMIPPFNGVVVLQKLILSMAKSLTGLFQPAVVMTNIFMWQDIIDSLPAIPSALEYIGEEFSTKKRSVVKQPQRAKLNEDSTKTILSVIQKYVPGISMTEPLMETGMNSSDSGAFVNELGAKLDLELPATLVFDHPTVLEISSYLEGVRKPQQEMSRKHGPGSMESEIADKIREQIEISSGLYIEEDEPIMGSGLDSLGATNLSKSLEDIYHVDLGATAMMDYPTIRDLTQYISSKIRRNTDSLQVSYISAPLKPGSDRTTYITSISSKVPGENVSSIQNESFSVYGRNERVGIIPLDRWDIENHYAVDPTRMLFKLNCPTRKPPLFCSYCSYSHL